MAAIVTSVGMVLPDMVCLAVFYPDGYNIRYNVHPGDTDESYRWHWPERTEK